MKAIILNASPRKNWNTAQLLKAAQQGAEEAGAETEYIDLYDLNFTGCRSCLACKRKDGERCKCFWKDDLSPLLERVFAADVLLIGSPIYLGDTTSQFHAFVERLHFCMLSYDDYSSYFTGKVNVGVVFTMNAPQALYQIHYKRRLAEQTRAFRALNGTVQVLASCDTLQVKDYSKFSMASFNETRKKAHHEKQFPLDLQKARQMGAELVQLAKGNENEQRRSDKVWRHS